jgi:hypothetical protein
MKRSAVWKWSVLLLTPALFALLSCRNVPDVRPYREPPPANLSRTNLDYADTDAFDALFESALVNQDPVIVIRTGQEKPEWEGRLNAWIAAWNRGGKVETATSGQQVRGQAPLPKVVVDGESIREFRFLVEGFMDRVENLARTGSAWWAEERVRNRHVALLRPYNLHFHLAEDRTILLIFFNGRYPSEYRAALPAIADTIGDDEAHGRARAFTCSRCKTTNRAARAVGEGNRDGAPVRPQAILSFE